MAEQQFFAAAVFAFLGWMAATVLAVIRSNKLTLDGAKAVCWFIPVAGLLLLIYLVYDGLYGDAGGFRYFAMALVSVIFWGLAVILPLLQLVFGYFAKVLDRSDG